MFIFFQANLMIGKYERLTNDSPDGSLRLLVSHMPLLGSYNYKVTDVCAVIIFLTK